MIMLFLQALWYLLPAHFANMAPVLCKRNLKFLNKPVDANKTLGEKPIFGTNKTWRGLLVAVLFGIGIAFIQRTLFLDYVWASNISLINYENWILFGALMGAGAIIGDLIESFFKRRRGIGSGKRWLFFDQFDYVVGALLFTMPLYLPNWQIILMIFAVSFLLHVLTKHIGFWIGVNKDKW